MILGEVEDGGEGASVLTILSRAPVFSPTEKDSLSFYFFASAELSLGILVEGRKSLRHHHLRLLLLFFSLLFFFFPSPNPYYFLPFDLLPASRKNCDMAAGRTPNRKKMGTRTSASLFPLLLSSPSLPLLSISEGRH